MLRETSEKVVARYLLVGSAAVTLVVFTQGITDPVNVTKFFLIGGLAFGLIAATNLKSLFTLISTNRTALLSLGLFLAGSLNSLATSSAPFSQTLYGVYGRNNGFLLYFFLVLIFIVTLSISKDESFSSILKSLALAGCLNVIYCLWVIVFGDFIGWSNPYGNILGTLGNPNFIGAFLGMFSSLVFTWMIQMRGDKVKLSLLCSLQALVIFEIYQSHAIQGRVLLVAGFFVNVFYLIRSHHIFKRFAIPLILSGSTIAILAVLGTLQKGPLAPVLYKDSVSLRGQYWFSGIKMGEANMISGVGFDAYGDWYRYFRRATALIRPGIDTVSNTAHNVFIDLFAFGGLPLLCAYILITISVIISILKLTFMIEKFDPIFVGLTGTWICFQLQSIISINQIGLAIWGWTLGAALIAYCRVYKLKSAGTTESIRKVKKSTRQETEIISPGLRAGIGLVIGFLIAVPPLSSDMKWRTAQTSGNVAILEDALKPSYLNPPNTFKYLSSVGVLENSGFKDLAHKYSLEAVRFNSNSYESWRLFINIEKATEVERQKALLRMSTLDPLNPSFRKPKE